MVKEFYFVSDLHFGGDGQLQICDFAEEFVEFLETLARRDKETELIIAGDTFGFWELTSVEGAGKFDEIVKHHREIFEQLKRTGERIQITMMVGNHDYDLACDPLYREKLAAYNITLDTATALTREIGGRKIWVEHGQQVDSFNASPDYGNPYAVPSGYFITKNFVGTAAKSSVFGTRDWLKDIRSVAVQSIPDWLVSNYFYNEMNFVIRWLLLPFLLLLTVTTLAIAAQILTRLGIFDVNIVLDNPLLRSLGVVGNVLHWILAISMSVWTFVFAVSIPLYFIYRDARSVVIRFRIFPPDKSESSGEQNNAYLARAREVFRAEPNVCAYIFGHTHDAFLIEEDNRVVFNTGTWLKILRRVPVRFGLLPAVYYPTFRLNFFKIYEENERITIDYIELPKKPEENLTLLQRVLIFGRKPERERFIPAKTVLQTVAPVNRVMQDRAKRKSDGAAEI